MASVTALTNEQIISIVSLTIAALLSILTFRYFTPAAPDLISIVMAFAIFVSITGMGTTYFYPFIQERVLNWISSLTTIILTFVTGRAVAEKYQISFSDVKAKIEESEDDVILPSSHISPLFGGMANPESVDNLALILFGATCLNMLLTGIGLATAFAFNTNVIGPSYPGQLPTKWTMLNDCQVPIFGGDLDQACSPQVSGE